jgi:hypothetical protein
MKKPILIIASLLLAAAPAAAQKVRVDWDRGADFESFKTFAWAETAPTSLEANYPLVHSLIKNAVEYELSSGGLVEDTEDPDLYVTYHTSEKEQLQFLTTSFGYSYGPFWGGSYASSSLVNTWEKGTLVIDIWDARKKEAVFRGSASKVFSEDPKKALKQVDKSITKISEKFRKMRAKEQ